jgi:hypothetical protein
VDCWFFGVLRCEREAVAPSKTQERDIAEENNMNKKYKVQCYTDGGAPKDGGLYHDIEAPSMLEAARTCCGCEYELTSEKRQTIFLRADVKDIGKPNEHNFFYKK